MSSALRRFLLPILGLILIAPSFWFLFKPGYYNMHDDMQMIRQLEMEKCLRDGQIPCRWTPDLGYGYGYPLFNYYPPLPYFIGQIYRTFGASFVTTVKLTAITQFTLSALAMYLLSSSLFGPAAGLLSAVFYTYAPYHAVNIYIRGAMNEAWALVFFPLIFYFSRKLIVDKKTTSIPLLALSLSGLLLSHNPMTLTFAPFALLWSLYFLIHSSSPKKDFLRLFLSACLALGLSAFFTLPAIAEMKLVQINSMFDGYYQYFSHFTSLYQLFISTFWGSGSSVWGQQDQMSFMIGHLHWSIPLILLSGILLLLIRRKYKPIHLLSGIVIFFGFVAAFMTHERSIFVWRLIPLIQKIQFPWRFLGHATFFFSLSIGSITTVVKKPFAKPIIIVLILTVIGYNFRYFHPLESGPLTDDQKFSGQAWTNQVTSSITDYLPLAVTSPPVAPATPFIDKVVPDQDYRLYGQKMGSDWQFFNLELPQEAVVTLSVFDYPRFTVQDNGQPISHSVDPTMGRIQIHLNPGHHQIYLKLQNTPVRQLSNLISLIAWSYIILFALSRLWTQFKSTK